MKSHRNSGGRGFDIEPVYEVVGVLLEAGGFGGTLLFPSVPPTHDPLKPKYHGRT